MSKTEILKLLAQQQSEQKVGKVEQRMAALAEQVQRVKEAEIKSAEELSRVITPLAQAIASLTDDYKEIHLQAREELARILQEAQSVTGQLNMTRLNIEKTFNVGTRRDRDTLEELQNASRWVRWRMWLMAALTSALLSLGVIGYLTWQERKKAEHVEWTEKTLSSLHAYLIYELYPNLNQRRQAEIRALYKEVRLKFPEDPEKQQKGTSTP